MDPIESSTSSYAAQLSQSEIETRDRFVAEYLVDYDAYKACIRIGYSPAYAKDFCVRFMAEPYVLNKIKATEFDPSAPVDIEQEKKKVLAGLWREANNFGAGSSQAARVAALSKLSAFYGMDAPKKTQTEVTGPDGQPLGAGVFVVPGAVTLEDWAEQAAKQQEELVRPTGKPELRVA